MNRSTDASQTQSPRTGEDTNRKSAPAERGAKRKTPGNGHAQVAVRPWTQLPATLLRATSLKTPLSETQKRSGKRPPSPAKMLLHRVNPCATQSSTKGKGGPKAPFFCGRTRPVVGRTPTRPCPIPRRLRPQERNGALVRRGRYPSRLSAPHETMINAFPFPGRRAQAGEAETRLFAGLAPHARAISPAASSGKAPDPDFCAR